MTLIVSEMSCVPDNHILVFHRFAIDEIVDVFLHFIWSSTYGSHSVVQFITMVPQYPYISDPECRAGSIV
jgi:hypothetical protein